MIRSDYHIHTEFSGDAEAPIKDMVEKSIALGLSRICFTDHMDFDYPYEEIDFNLDTERYIKTVAELKEQYQEKIQILTGIEMGMQPCCADKAKALLEKHPFDFVIGSIHLLNGWDPYWWEERKGSSEQEVIREYLQAIAQNIDLFPNIHVVGHIDYIVRYGPGKWALYDWREYEYEIEGILKKVVEKGLGIELNSSGYRYPDGKCHPHPDIIRRYRELGGKIITVGSDAHKPEQLAFCFDKAKKVLLEAGFSHYTIFCGGKPEFIKLT